MPLTIPPANITVVRTAEELQQATLSGAVDIEIRAHLDLRGLQRAANPAILGVETGINRKRLALLYATPPLRSIRGNCSEPDAVSMLGVPPAGFPDLPELLPLKPRQCLLVVGDTWLMLNEGKVWIDNVYLTLSRRDARPSFTFITAGALDGELQWPSVLRSDIYITGVTFHGEYRGNARGVVADFTLIAIYLDGCIFTDWAGFASPITLKFQSIANIRNTVFRNIDLHVELVDVSFEGMVSFQDVLFVNVTLEHGSVVSTTGNDYQSAIGFYLSYYAEDDANYDVAISAVPRGHRSVFGEQFAVENSSISDCVYLLRSPDLALPGCPDRTNEARNRTIDRDFVADDRESSGVPFDSASLNTDYSGPMGAADYAQLYPAGAPYADYYAILGPTSESDYQTHTVSTQWSDYEVANDPWKRFSVMTTEQRVWLDQTREVLPPLAPAPPGWPPFLPPPPPPEERTSLRPEPVQPSPSAAEKMLGPIGLAAPPATQPGARQSGRVDAMTIALIVAVELLVAAALVWVCVAKGSQIERWWTRRWTRPHRQTSHRGDGHRPRKSKGPQSRRRVDTAGNQPSVNHKNPYVLNPQGSEDTSEVSRGVDVPPTSLMNSDYEYCLPTHLALFALPASLDPDSADAQEGAPGSMVVVTPDTVECFQPGEPDTTATFSHQAWTSTGASHSKSDQARDGPRDSVSQRHSAAFHRLEQPPTSTDRKVDILKGGSSKTLLSELQSRSKETGGAARSMARTAAGGHAGRRLQRQLDSFTASDLFLGRFEMLGRQQQRRGGQAIVQFAVNRQDRCEYAVKFFLDYATFLTEAALYEAAFPGVCSTGSPEVAEGGQQQAETVLPPKLASAPEVATMPRDVARFLPQVEAVCDGAGGGLEDPRGRPLPPCIVMEKGESLQDFCNRAEPDIFTILAVLSNVSSRVADMHAAGYVHRDLKPANVMWLPRQNRWTVIDFGCVARVGEAAPLSFTLAYAAPEVVAACRGRRKTIEAQPALDAWSMGVMAFELLSGAPAFDLLSIGRGQVLAMLAGDVPLPWEGELSAERQRSLGVFKEPVLRLLHRDPALRITLDAFHSSCTRTRLFAS